MKKVLITGTSRGLGKALAEGFVKRNYHVIATARDTGDIQIDGGHQKIPLVQLIVLILILISIYKNISL